MIENLKCVECGQQEEPMLVFVGTYRLKDGTIKKLPEGMHPYCGPCREKLNITDELNAGRDLRAEAKQVTLDAVERARQTDESPEGKDKGTSIIMDAVDDWIGGTDSIAAMLGRRVPKRPQAVFDGVSDAMAEIDPSTLTPTLAIALITITNSTKGRIANWDDFVQRTYKHLQGTMPGQAKNIMIGFV
jgi:hypothetical protein